MRGRGRRALVRHPAADLAARGARLVVVFGGRVPRSAWAGTDVQPLLPLRRPLTPDAWADAYVAAPPGIAADAIDALVIDPPPGFLRTATGETKVERG